MHIYIIQDIINLIRHKIFYREFKRNLYKFLCGKKINYYNCNFDEIISLGYNCEISQRLCDIFIDANFQHYLFTWSYQYDKKLFIQALQNLSNFVDSQYSILPWGMIKHEKYNIGFHSRYSKEELLNHDGTYTSNVPIALDELKDRLKYLSKKLLNIFESKNNILFIIKLQYTNLDDDVAYIKELNTVIESFFSKRNAKYTILVVLSKKDYPNMYMKQLIQINIKNVTFGIIKSFAQDAYTDVDGDVLGWYKLLKTYIKRK